jgi:hypothetical protein
MLAKARRPWRGLAILTAVGPLVHLLARCHHGLTSWFQLGRARRLRARHMVDRLRDSLIGYALASLDRRRSIRKWRRVWQRSRAGRLVRPAPGRADPNGEQAGAD